MEPKASRASGGAEEGTVITEEEGVVDAGVGGDGGVATDVSDVAANWIHCSISADESDCTSRAFRGAESDSTNARVARMAADKAWFG